MIGKNLSHYHITAELGRGGMGIVYKAEDTKLDREVAIKVLPIAALASEDDRARFYREAKAAAGLNHPNIAAVYGIEEAVPSDAPHGTEPSPFIAMEYIDGEPLDVHIKSGPVPLSDALKLATQIASALEAAHDKNIVHRDIKSANVMLTKKGDAKVLDFGLAKTAQSTMLTKLGSTLGTIAYMSPEQARGEEVDHRTDLWALGIVLYEMIAGRIPFAAEYEQAAVYSILNEDPEPLTALRTGVPMELEFVVNKLLAKETRHRYQGAKEVLADLSALSERPTSRLSSTSARTSNHAAASTIAAGKSSKSGPLAGIVVGVIGLALGVLLTWFVLRSTSRDLAGNDPTMQARPMRLSLNLPVEYPMSFFGGSVVGVELTALNISRDGSRLVYVADSAGVNFLVMNDMGSNSFRRLPDTENGFFPVFSPDALSVAFFVGGDLRTIRLGSSRSELIAAVSDPIGILWSDDGSLYWLGRQGSTLMRSFPGENLDPEIVIEGCGCIYVGQGQLAGELILLDRSESLKLFQDNSFGESLALDGSHANFQGADRLVFTRSGSLLGAQYDRRSNSLVGQTLIMLSDLRVGSIFGAGQYSFSDHGTLIYAPGGAADISNLVIRNIDGTEESLPISAETFGSLDATRDGGKIVVRLTDGSDRTMFYDLTLGSSRVVAQERGSHSPILNSDGTKIYYSISRQDSTTLVIRSVDSGGSPETILTFEGEAAAYDLSSDGRLLAYGVRKGNEEIRIRDLEDGSESVIKTDVGNRIWAAKFSPDDTFVAYTEVGPNGSEVYVESYPLSGNRRGISSAGCEEPEWRDDIREIIYRCTAGWFKVAYIIANGAFLAEAPELLFQGPYLNIAGMEYRILSDGRSLLQKPVNTERTTDRLEVVTNWFTEIDELLGDGDGS